MKSSSQLVLLYLFTPFTQAVWTTGKAVQLNFYKDATCTQYDGEVAAYYSKSPEVGYTVNNAGAARAECITLGMPADTKSINVAAVWTDSADHARWTGYCLLFDGYGCTGNLGQSKYSATGGTCEASRSPDAYLWKSAKCLVD